MTSRGTTVACSPTPLSAQRRRPVGSSRAAKTPVGVPDSYQTIARIATSFRRLIALAAGAVVSREMSAWSYRERLRREGAALAAAGAVGSALLLLLVAAASASAASTAAQIAFVAVMLAVAGPRLVRRWLAGAQPVPPGARLTGEPTGLWKPPLVVVALTGVFVVPGQLGVGGVAWDAGLRITLGCLLVGLAQALLLERVVAADEARSGRRYVRLPGSSAASGTNLGFVLSGPADPPREGSARRARSSPDRPGRERARARSPRSGR